MGLLPSNNHSFGYWFNRQLTFLLVVIGWVLFRSADVQPQSYGFQSVAPACRMLAEMLGLYGSQTAATVTPLSTRFWMVLALCWGWCNFAPNSYEVVYRAHPRRIYAVLAGVTMALCLLQFGTPVDFLYFRF